MARACSRAWPLCMLCRGGPDGQLRTAEPVCLIASRTSCHIHRTSAQSPSHHEQVPARSKSASPRVGRGPTLRQMSTQYTQDIVAAATVTGFLSPRT